MSICYNSFVKLIGRERIDTFKKKHPTSRKALDRWIKLLENATLKTPQDVKNLFGVNVDFVGNQAVFDVGGNKVRAITKIQFGVQIILVTNVLTHEDYDKDKWRD
jgi:mRNA interferase HigB